MPTVKRKKKKKTKTTKKATCNESVDRVITVLTSPVVLNAAVHLIQGLRGGKT